MRSGRRTAIAIAMAAGLAACASGGRRGSTAAAPAAPAWPVVTHERVDLWLHGYAMLTRDAAQVPVFRRGYRDSLNAVRRRGNVLTALDVNHDRLAALMVQNPEIGNGQFTPLYFTSWDQMIQAINAFVRADGNARQADPATRQQFAVIGSMYPTAQDREWLRLFTQSLTDESDHFYHQYWMTEEQARRGVVASVDSLWSAVRPRFQRFLTNTQQTGGELALSLVLGGEGRTFNASPARNLMVVTLPPSPAAAAQAVYVFAHEAVQGISNSAVADNTTPVEQRSGAAAGYTPLAAVRAGAMLMERVAPEFADGYMRFYLAQAGVSLPAGNVQPLFLATFQIPTAIAADLARLIENALGGI